jgi:hypothetical protein
MLKTRAWPRTARCGAARFAIAIGVAAMAAVVPSAPARAAVAGFAGSPSAAVLGQSLDFAIGVRMEGGESVTAECVTAEVMFGDRRLLPGQVRTLVEATGADTARIRVQTAAVVDEPLVSVQVNAGCGNRVSRRFVVLADPPVGAPPAPPLPMLGLANVPEAAAMVPTRSATSAAEPNPRAAALSVSETATVKVSTRVAPRTARAAGLSSGMASGDSLRAVVGAVARAARPRVRTESPVRAARVATTASRLKLEPAEPAASRRVAPAESSQIIEDAIEAVAQAASAARATAAAASASAERIAALERSVDQLSREAKANQALLEQSRERMQRAEDAARWTLPLIAAAVGLGGLSVWLGMRLRKAQMRREAEWRAAAAPVAVTEPNTGKQPTAPIPFVTAATQPPPTNPGTRPFENTSAPDRWAPATVSMDRATATMPLAPAEQPEPAVMRTDLLPPRTMAEDGHARDVSIEELLDLEQQAEFFVVLGQDEAAVDLLIEHLRQTGGGSPLPYLKLLEIHRRRGDRIDYEAIRNRFNHRFNAYAPDWNADMQDGRSLEDYPGVIPRLEEVWPRPMEAMAELEALLFRKSRGELFDLPAYREVLFLYALARDLLDRESAGTGDVDLLLPLSGSAGSAKASSRAAAGSGFSSTSPAPFMGLGELDELPGPGSTVDFDLSVEIDRQSSIFDTLEELPPSRRPQ